MSYWIGDGKKIDMGRKMLAPDEVGVACNPCGELEQWLTLRCRCGCFVYSRDTAQLCAGFCFYLAFLIDRIAHKGM